MKKILLGVLLLFNTLSFISCSNDTTTDISDDIDNNYIVLKDNLITINTTGDNYGYIRYTITPTNLTYKYDARIVDVNGNVVFEILNESGVRSLSANIIPNGVATQSRINTYRLEISPKIYNSFSVNLESTIKKGYYGSVITSIESIYFI